MLYLEQEPDPRLRQWIRRVWYCRGADLPRGRERVLPNGCMQIVINLSRQFLTSCGPDGTSPGRLPGAVVVGARARYQVIDTADMGELAGIAFQPWGFTGLVRERADAFFGRHVPLDDVWVGARLGGRLVDHPTPAGRLGALQQLLIRRFAARARRSPLVTEAVHLLRHRSLRVADCARSTGVSARRLSQVFHEQVGMAPKTWYRVQRFQAAVRALHDGMRVPWAELALRCGYYDQSHFANDFRAFSGISPTVYSASRGPWQNHVPMP